MSDGAPPLNGMDFSGDDLGLLQQLLGESGADPVDAAVGIRRRAVAAHAPLSFAQELLWLLDRASPGMTAYNMPVANRLVGALDLAALQQSFTALVARHEALRTRFDLMNGEPVQLIDPPEPMAMTIVDLRSVPAPARDGELATILGEQVRRPFDMARDHLFRAMLVRLTDEDQVLLLETHHIVCDGWSMGVLWRELAALYAASRSGSKAELPEVPFQYGDFAVWQRERLQGEQLERQLAFWRGQIGGVNESLDLPTDFPRPVTPTFAGGRATLLLPRTLLDAVKQLGRSHEATLYMVLLAAYTTVLHRYTGRRQILVGSGSAGRTDRDTEGMVGYLNNTLVQLGDFTGDPAFGELLRRVREAALGAYDHQEVPLEKLVLELREGSERLSAAPLFQVVFTMQNAAEARLALDGVEVRSHGIDFGITKFDLTLLPSEREDGLLLFLRYRSDLYTQATAERFLGHVRRVLEAAVADPSQPVSAIPLLTDAELGELAGWNAAPSSADLMCIHERVAANAMRTPDARAIVGADGTLAWREFDARANQIAHRLIALGVAPGAAVGLCLDRSAEAIGALVGVMKAGACYVPLVPELPSARLANQIEQAGVAVVVTRSAFAARLPGDRVRTLSLDSDSDAITASPTTAPGVSVALGDRAYILFTSGSTGVPKGVAVTHANIANYTNAMLDRLECSGEPPLSFATVSTLAADLGNTAIFPALASGGTLHVIPSDVATDPARFGEYVAAHPIDVLKITPNHLHALSTGSHGDAVFPRRWLVMGGETLPWDLAGRVLRTGRCRVMNHYGPTEGTVGCATFHVTDAGAASARADGAQTVPIGYPLAGVQLHVVDEKNQQVPVGVPGELLIGGAGVAQGYVGQVERTAEMFVTLPGLGRVYRTGDRVRRLATGALEFLGRRDGQVKVRGFRVELGEVEQVLATHPSLAQAAVVLQCGAAGDALLAAYVVAKAAGYAAAHSERPTPERLSAWLAERLPDYMVPGVVVLLPEFPLTVNGKVDRAALASQTAATTVDTFVAPRTPLEESLVTIWTEVLKRDRVGVADEFLALGGHSLLAIRVLGRISKQFGVRLPLRALFEKPTIAQLAEEIDLELRLAALDRMTDEEAAKLLGDQPGPAGAG